jgi:hypothetical protein
MFANARETSFKQFNATSLCNADDVVYFSCRIKKMKTISLCGAKTEKETPYLYYRFGKQDNIEMEYPNAKDKGSLTKFSYIRRSRAQLNDVSVSFQRDSYGYTIYSYYDNERSDENADVGRGVIVGRVGSKNTKTPFVNIKCADELIDHLALTTYFLPCDEEQEYLCNVGFDEYGKSISREKNKADVCDDTRPSE